MFEISKETIPAPPPRRGIPQYPFAAMQVGQHFDAPRDMGTTEIGTDIRQRSISSSSKSYARRINPGAKFTTRLVSENTVRCWRIA